MSEDITGTAEFSIAKYTILDQLTKSLIIEYSKLEKFKTKVYDPSLERLTLLAEDFSATVDFNTLIEGIDNNLNDFLPNLQVGPENQPSDFVTSFSYMLDEYGIKSLPIDMNNYLSGFDSSSTELPKNFLNSSAASIILGTINNLVKCSESDEFLIASICFGIIYNIGLCEVLQSIINVSNIVYVIINNFTDTTNVEEIIDYFNNFLNLLSGMYISNTGLFDIQTFLEDFATFSPTDIYNIILAMNSIQILLNYATGQISELVPNISRLSLASNTNVNENNNPFNSFGGTPISENDNTVIINNTNNSIETILDDITNLFS